MFEFLEDFFDFSDDDSSEERYGGSDNPISDIAETFFESWQDSANDFFGMLDDAAPDGTAQDFVDAWHQATQDFADQYASWWGWNDGSPV
jgi:hypothetical protein